MKRATKLVLGGAAAIVVLRLFLLPTVTINVGEVVACDPLRGCIMPTDSASASPMYAYLRIGAVYVHSPFGIGCDAAAYCFMVENPGTMCGFPIERMNQETTSV